MLLIEKRRVICVKATHLLTRSVPPVRAVAVQPEGVDVHRARLPPRQPLRPPEVLRVLYFHLGEKNPSLQMH